MTTESGNQAGQDSADEKRERRILDNPWLMLATLTLLFATQTIDRNLISVLAEPIKHEFALSDAQLGLLAGTVFAVSYVIAGIPIGMLVDRTHRIRLIAALLAVWSGLTLLTGTARSFSAMVLARIGIAAAESGATPTCMSILSDVFPKHKRATAMGLFHSASPLGLLLGFSLGGLIAAQYGWRAAFFIAGIPGILLSLFVFMALREPRRGAMEPGGVLTAATRAYPFRVVVAEMWKRKVLRYLTIACVLTIAGQSSIGAFFAPFLIRVHHLPLAQVGLVVGLTLGLGGMAGTALGGVFSDWSDRRSPVGGIRMASMTMLAAAVIAVAGLLQASLVLGVGLLGVYVFLMSFYYGAVYNTFISNTPVPMRGAAIAVMIILMNLLGYGLGPQIAGILSDSFNRAGTPDSLRWALVCTSGFFVLASAFFWAGKTALARDLADRDT